ncbi:MAG: hypothetical protein FJ026_07045 [Chloroflexi bacterium]|nr:hypothetical protein [Chloroflexota bacterium]
MPGNYTAHPAICHDPFPRLPLPPPAGRPVPAGRLPAGHQSRLGPAPAPAGSPRPGRRVPPPVGPAPAAE